MNKNLIVSSADEKYFQLLKELYNSTLNLKYVSFAVLDCGLSDESKRYFIDKNIEIFEPDWEFEIPSYKIRGRNYLKAQFSRFYLEKYFPGYENYIWIDSDAWISCNDTFDYYIQGSNKTGFAITPQIDRASSRLINIKWFMNFPTKINSINFKNISKSISKNLAKKYAGHFTLNAGCFAYNHKFSGMKAIRENLKKASQKGRVFGTDQVALAISLFENNLEFELLPAYCNWLCEHHMPKFSVEKNKFVEPFIPNHNIGVMHLAGLDEDRKTKIFHKIKTTDDKILEKTLRYSI